MVERRDKVYLRSLEHLDKVVEKNSVIYCYSGIFKDALIRIMQSVFV